MNVGESIVTLKAKHARLEREIDEESHRPMPDTALIHALKREKLRIKDEIEGAKH